MKSPSKHYIFEHKNIRQNSEEKLKYFDAYFDQLTA